MLLPELRSNGWGCVKGPLAVRASVRFRGEARGHHHRCRSLDRADCLSASPVVGERPVPPRPGHPDRRGGWNDAEAGMPSAEASGAICVQKLDDSRNSAIHIRCRISLRSSSLWEPRYPLLRVVCFLCAPVRVRRLQGSPWSADPTQ